MSRRRRLMREIKTILYYRIEKGISAEKTSKALNISKGTVINTLNRFEVSGLTWPLPDDMSDTTLQHLLYPKKPPQPTAGVAELPTVLTWKPNLSDRMLLCSASTMNTVRGQLSR
jgi:hypothetical protein